jgi:hypothetical protein
MPVAILTLDRLGGDGCFPVYVERGEEASFDGRIISRIIIEVEHGPDDEAEWQKRVKGEVP